MSHRIILIDGQLPHLARPIDVDDSALTLGISAFETLRSVGGRLPLLDHHLGRLRHTTDTLGIQF
ncbi:MAG: hypothetical protein AAFV53_38745, partial [Myxococcota bacterium]